MFEVTSKGPIFEISHKYVENPSAAEYLQHTHPYCELLLFVSGDANFNIDGILHRPKPYDLLIIPQATYHYFIPRSPQAYENYVLDFSPDLIPIEHRQKLFSKPTILNIGEDADFCRFFELLDLYHETYKPEDFSLVCRSLLRELLIFCSYRMDSSTPVESVRNPLVETMLKLIAENLEKPLDADFLAREMMLSKSYVQNVFSQEMHIGLKKYIIQKKLFAAQADLAAGMSAADVCAKYEFSDYSSFFRHYKQTMGVSPRETKRGGA